MQTADGRQNYTSIVIRFRPSPSGHNYPCIQRIHFGKRVCNCLRMTTPDLIVTGLELFSRTAALKNIIAFTVTARTIRNRAAQIRGRHPYGRQRFSIFGTPSQLMFWKYVWAYSKMERTMFFTSGLKPL